MGKKKAAQLLVGEARLRTRRIILDSRVGSINNFVSKNCWCPMPNRAWSDNWSTPGFWTRSNFWSNLFVISRSSMMLLWMVAKSPVENGGQHPIFYRCSIIPNWVLNDLAQTSIHSHSFLVSQIVEVTAANGATPIWIFMKSTIFSWQKPHFFRVKGSIYGITIPGGTTVDHDATSCSHFARLGRLSDLPTGMMGMIAIEKWLPYGDVFLVYKVVPPQL